MLKPPHSGPADPNSAPFRAAWPWAWVLCATLLAYLPALFGGFIWNDSDYVTAPALRTAGGLARIWTDIGATQQYYPLLHTAFWIEHRLWGDHPLGYHAATLLLHAGSSVLLGWVLLRLLSIGPAPPAPKDSARVAGLAALLFALHPAHVESVAWITEQKNTLSLAFYLAAALLYLRFDGTRRPRDYAAALALFALSLGCKTVTATLPAALLVALWWRRGRLGWRRDVLPLVPWFAAGAAAGLFSSWVEQAYIGAQGSEFRLSPAARLLVAGRDVWFYLGKFAWPRGLNFIYPRWTVDAADGGQWLFPLAALAAGAALWVQRGRSRGPLAAYLFFVGSLFPVLGFVNLYGARYSWVWDHWQYLPDAGLCALAAAGLSEAWRRTAPHARGLGAAMAAALAALLGALSWSHCAMFHDDEALYLATLERNPGSWMAHNNLGNLWSKTPGRQEDAIAQFDEALRLRPDYAEAHNNLGCVLATLPGRLNEAIAHYEEALRVEPDNAEAHNNLGCALATLPGRQEDAVAQFEDALRLRPDYPKASYNLGCALAAIPGRLAEAVAAFEAALRADPGNAEAHYRLGSALAAVPGRSDDAITQYEAALRLKPDYPEAHDGLGNAWAKVPGRLDDAIAQYGEALRLKPDYAEAHDNLGNAWAKVPGRLGDAVSQFEEALRLNPGDARAHNNLGCVLAAIPGRLEDAIAQEEEAVRLRPGDASMRFNLAVALLQAPGRTQEAVAQLREVVRLQPGNEVARQMLSRAAALQ